MVKVLAGALLAIALVLGDQSTARGGDALSVSYQPVGWYGEISIAGAPAADFAVWGQQPDGGYALVASGALGTAGTAAGFVPIDGPFASAPQFIIEVSGAGGGILAIDDPGQQWWVE